MFTMHLVLAVDAVYALAHALHNMTLERCGSITLCDRVRPVPSGQELLQHIRGVSFTGELSAGIGRRPAGFSLNPGSYMPGPHACR